MENEAPIAHESLFVEGNLEKMTNRIKAIGAIGVIALGIAGASYLSGKLSYKVLADYDSQAQNITYLAHNGQMREAEREESLLRESISTQLRNGELDSDTRSQLATRLSNLDYNGVSPDQ